MSQATKTPDERTESNYLPKRRVRKHGYKILGGDDYYRTFVKYVGMQTRFDEVEEVDDRFRLYYKGVRTGDVMKDSRVPKVILGELRDVADST